MLLFNKELDEPVLCSGIKLAFEVKCVLAIIWAQMNQEEWKSGVAGPTMFTCHGHNCQEPAATPHTRKGRRLGPSFGLNTITRLVQGRRTFDRKRM